MSGCANQSSPPAAASPAPPAVSFDGRYQGSVQVSGVASGGLRSQCATDPQPSWTVTNGTFTYVQAHPNVAGTAPSLTQQSTTATYTATISPDGSIQGDSGNLNGTIRGTASGSHMSGTISGVLCYYTFTADRI